MSEWTPILALPNLDAEISVGNDYTAIAHPNDSRLSDAVHRQPEVGVFLKRFTDSLGTRVSPAVILVRSDAPKAAFDTEAIAGFRDAVAACTIPLARARRLLTNVRQEPIWGEAFETYVWFPTTGADGLIGETEDFRGTRDLEPFFGQTNPRISRQHLGDHSVDKVLLEATMVAWEQCFIRRSDDWNAKALFRSLNMAYHATLLPGGTETGIYDVGRLLTLWVNAFDLLAHTGPTGGVTFSTVADMIDRAPWLDSSLADKAHMVGPKGQKADHTLASSIYFHLVRLRHDFTHGNPLRVSEMTRHGRPVFAFASSLYRMALVSALDVRAGHDEVTEVTTAALIARMRHKEKYHTPQDPHETVLKLWS